MMRLWFGQAVRFGQCNRKGRAWGELGKGFAISAAAAAWVACAGSVEAGMTYGGIPGTTVALQPERTPQDSQPRIVALCVVPGAKDRYVITSDSRLVQITASGEVSAIGVVTPPTSDQYRCMIKTANALVGVTSNGHLVNTENGEVVGALVAVKPNGKVGAPDANSPSTQDDKSDKSATPGSSESSGDGEDSGTPGGPEPKTAPREGEINV